jgi:DNA-binding PadR family transcriptional regulator
MARRDRMLAWAGESQYYTEPKRLAKLGYLSARKQPGKTRERTVYLLTDEGIRALHAWARTPVGVTPLKSEALIRLLICDLVGEQVTRASMATLRDDIEDIRGRLADARRRAHSLPYREKYLRLVLDFMNGLLDLHAELIDNIERDLEATPDPPRPRLARRRADARDDFASADGS